MSHLKPIELKGKWFQSKEGKVVNVEESTAQEFHEFITQYMDVVHVDVAVWPFVMRWKALEFALDQNIPLRFVDKVGGTYVTDKRPDTVHEDVNPIEKKEEDLSGGEENVLRVPHGGA